MIVVGDFGQLPVVKGKWAFEAKSWPKFEQNTIKLTKNWRAESDPLFIEFLLLVSLGQEARVSARTSDQVNDLVGHSRTTDDRHAPLTGLVTHRTKRSVKSRQGQTRTSDVLGRGGRDGSLEQGKNTAVDFRIKTLNTKVNKVGLVSPKLVRILSSNS